MMQEYLHGLVPIELQHLGKEERDVALRGLKQLEGLSTRQIARLTGISQSVIVRA
jgi:putative transposase